MPATGMVLICFKESVPPAGNTETAIFAVAQGVIRAKRDGRCMGRCLRTTLKGSSTRRGVRRDGQIKRQ